MCHRTPFPGRAAAPALLAGLLASPALADIQLGVVASPDPARPGEVLDLEITVTNDGAFDRTDVEVLFDFPAGLQGLADGLYDGDCPGSACEPGEQATFAIATLPAGKGITYSIPARLTGSVPDDTVIPFDVAAFDDGKLEAESTTDVTVDATRELELAAIESRDPVAPGETIDYVIAYGVFETGAGSPDAMLRFAVPAGTTFVAADGGGAEQDGFVEWALGNINPGVSGERRVTVEVNKGLEAGAIVTTNVTFDDDASNAVAHETATRVQDTMPLELVVIASPDPARPGEVLDVELTATNTGAFDLNDVTLALEFPQSIAPITDGFYDGDCPGSGCEAQERAVFDVGTLPAGKGITYSIPLQLSGATLDGDVIALEAALRDSTGATRESGATLRAAAGRPLELALVENRDPAAPGDAMTYQLAFGVREDNAGSVDTMLRLELPDEVTVVAASDGGVDVGGAVEWALGDLNPGASGERQVLVAVADDADAGATPAARAFLDNAAGDEVAYDAATRVESTIPLEVVVIASPDPAQPGEVLDVELTVTNRGAFDRTGVVLLLEIPDHLIAISDALYDGDCPGTGCEARERAVFDIGTIPAGEGLTFSMPLQVAGSAVDGTVLTLEAEVRDSPGDLRETGAHLTVEAGRQLDLAIVESDDAERPDERITYTVTYGTHEDGPGAPDATLLVELPPDTVVDSTSFGGVVGDGTVEWALGSLEPGAGGERVVTVIVDGPEAAAILPAHARIDDAAKPANQTRFSESTRLAGASPLDVELTVSPNPALPGQTLDLRLSVTNTTAFERNDIVLALEFPDGLQGLSEADFDGDCPGTGCEARETALFQIPILAAGEAVTFLVPPVVASGTDAGRVINFDARVSDAAGATALDGDAVKIGGGFDNQAGDSTFDGVVDFADLLDVLDGWGPCDDPDDCPADFNGDGVIDFNDLLVVLDRWN